MRANSYCKVCGCRNAPNIASCSTCGQPMVSAPRTNPMNSASFRSQSMIIFDIDDTILNVAQRYKDAKRAHLIDKDSYPIRKKTLETPGKARKRANQFLFSPENLAKDRVIPGALGLIDDLVAQGHVIAYVTGRHANFRDVTRNQLEDKGFPLFKNDAGMDLLFLKPTLGEKTPKYKHGVYDQLISQYDVRMVFDDQPENLQAAVTVGITGVYPSISDYTRYQVKSNPRPIVDYDKGEQYVTGTDSGEYAYQQRIDEDDPDGRTIEETSYTSNPFGLFRKKPKVTPPKPKPVKPSPAIEKKLLAYNNALIEYNDDYEPEEGPDGRPLRISREFVFDREPMAGGAHIYMIYDKDAMNGMFAVLKQVGYKVSDINTGESVTWKEFMKDPTSDGDRLGRLLTATQTEYHKLVGYLQHLTDEGKINGRTVHYAYKDGTSAGWGFQFEFDEVKNNPRSNPPKNKIEKGKKLYEHMNGKEPESVDVKKIDMGDVWYQVGEGGCWSIGYMSGKETGKAEQKYSHTFNEETKDGNFPKLYATMPENGKPLLIIQGGTWKIRTDDTGVAWIYD